MQAQGTAPARATKVNAGQRECKYHAVIYDDEMCIDSFLVENIGRTALCRKKKNGNNEQERDSMSMTGNMTERCMNYTDLRSRKASSRIFFYLR